MINKLHESRIIKSLGYYYSYKYDIIELTLCFIAQEPHLVPGRLTLGEFNKILQFAYEEVVKHE